MLPSPTTNLLLFANLNLCLNLQLGVGRLVSLKQCSTKDLFSVKHNLPVDSVSGSKKAQSSRLSLDHSGNFSNTHTGQYSSPFQFGCPIFSIYSKNITICNDPVTIIMQDPLDLPRWQVLWLPTSCFTIGQNCKVLTYISESCIHLGSLVWMHIIMGIE